MTMVKMQRVRIIAPSLIKAKLLRDLARHGCVEIESGDKEMVESGLMAQVEEAPSLIAPQLQAVTTALAALNRYAEIKKSLFAPKPTISESELFATTRREKALAIAETINASVKAIASLHNEENRLQSKKQALEPWQSLDIPLDQTNGQKFVHLLGNAPATVPYSALEEALVPVPAAALYLVSSDRNQHYLSLIVHRDSLEEALAALKENGFSTVSFKDISGTAAANIAETETRMEQIQQERQAQVDTIVAQKDAHLLLEQVYDQLTNENIREKLLLSLVQTKKTTYMEGWLPEAATEKIGKLLAENGCAYEFSDPAEGEDPPTYLENKPLFHAFGSITELYGMPAYGTVVDPNPFVAVFFFLFFGIMFSDAAYGLILTVIAAIYLAKAKPTGDAKRYITVALFVGISTVLWGSVFGSWFGDLIPTLSRMITGKEVQIPLLLDPLAQPMQMLILSLGLGMVHLFVGMGLAAYRMIKQGHFWDAVFDIGFWYLILLGLVGALVGIQAGIYMAAAGALGVLITGGRHKKGLGKITGGLGSLYGITSYLSDILSYSRLMALGLSTGVVATVMNTLGSLAGNGVIGWVLFIFVFAVGQTFNFAIGILGAFVHTCRLQFVEFFGKFFEGGGRAFAPLHHKTKYVQLLKEEN